ncbi:type II restriction endonuclease [Patescibacteria group bacterium]|nr:type II restriction endonuclease [Patescibacteria group bacterium]
MNNNMKKDFKNFIDTLNEDLFTWGYFVDFDKVIKNSFEIKILLNILNSLIGEKNIEEKFLSLAKKYPEVRGVLPILVATRIKKIKEVKILNINTMKSDFRSDLFNSKINLTKSDDDELLHFFIESGLKGILLNKNVSDLNDYVFGIEVGMDTNARKNRSGNLMEDVVFDILYEFVKENKSFSFIKQANVSKIKKDLNYSVEKNKNDRIFDFALLNKSKNKLFLIEVNLYGSGGTKLKSVAGEFEKVNNFILNQNIDFVWVTDGIGWKTAENPMKEAFENNKYTFNLKQFKDFLNYISK